MSTVHLPQDDFQFVERSMMACRDLTAPIMLIIASTYDSNLFAFVFNRDVKSFESHCTLAVTSVRYL
ncbi:MAG: hypothetical protein WCJ81_06220 [bacterium]